MAIQLSCVALSNHIHTDIPDLTILPFSSIINPLCSVSWFCNWNQPPLQPLHSKITGAFLAICRPDNTSVISGCVITRSWTTRGRTLNHSIKERESEYWSYVRVDYFINPLLFTERFTPYIPYGRTRDTVLCYMLLIVLCLLNLRGTLCNKA